MNFIIHPKTQKKINLFSNQGKQLLKNLIKSFYFYNQSGGLGKNNTPAHNAYIKFINSAFDENHELIDWFFDQFHEAQLDYDNGITTDEEFTNTLEQIKSEIEDSLNDFNPYNNFDDLQQLINDSNIVDN